MEVVTAGLLFYLPWAHFPPPRWLRTVILNVPSWGAGNETGFSITPFLVPEAIVVMALFLAALRVREFVPQVRGGSGLRPLGIAAGLTLVGGLVSLVGSSYLGISMAGYSARLTVFLLAVVIAWSGPRRSAVQLWVYAGIAGTCVMCLAGLYYFLTDVGLPNSLMALPNLRVGSSIVNYQKATYGIAGNTADLLVMTTPVCLALGLGRQTRVRARPFFLLAAFVMLANLLISFERWAWICIGVSLVLIALFNRAQLRSWLVLLALFGAAIWGSASITGGLGDYFGQALDPGSASSLLSRSLDWQEGVAVLLDNPAGTGFGTAGTLSRLSDTSSHNLFIDIGIEGGLLALAGAIVWTVFHIQLFVRVMTRARPGEEWAFALLLGALIFVLFGIFFNSLLYFSGLMVWLAFWWLLPVMSRAFIEPPVDDPAHVVVREKRLAEDARALARG